MKAFEIREFGIDKLAAVDLETPFFFPAEDGIRDGHVTGVQTCALPICSTPSPACHDPSPLSSRPRILSSISANQFWLVLRIGNTMSPTGRPRNSASAGCERAAR